MVHARTVNGETFVFGNQGGLFQNAMTWWDHNSGSVWSQVWGQSIAGPLKGTTLELIPAGIVPWGTWKTRHPDTLAMVNDKSGLFSREERPRDGWVVGIAIGEHSKAFDYRALVRGGLVNDFVGPFPVTVYTDPDTRNVQVYLRQAGEQVLTLNLDQTGQRLVDVESGTTWRLENGVAVEGELKGEALLSVPYISSFDWAWLDFHPESEIYR